MFGVGASCDVVVGVASCDVDVWCCASLEILINNPDSYEFRPLAFRSSLPSPSPRFFSASASGAGISDHAVTRRLGVASLRLRLPPRCLHSCVFLG